MRLIFHQFHGTCLGSARHLLAAISEIRSVRSFGKCHPSVTPAHPFSLFFYLCLFVFSCPTFFFFSLLIIFSKGSRSFPFGFRRPHLVRQRIYKPAYLRCPHFFTTPTGSNFSALYTSMTTTKYLPGEVSSCIHPFCAYG